MYIRYDKNQYHVDIHGRPQPGIKTFTGKYKVPAFKPEYLVRVSDMKRVSGANVKEHYCCLSYSWDQSGEINHIADGIYERIDRHRHVYIDYGEDGNPRNVKRENRIKHYCRFEAIIYEICKDHDIKYIWYDQMCIDQHNRRQKLREMKRMGQIFQNALFTVALVPELRRSLLRSVNWIEKTTSDRLSRHLRDFDYCKRIWTIAEAYNSNPLLFVGRDVHFYSCHLYEECSCTDTPINLFLQNFGFVGDKGRKAQWTAREALGYLADCECRNPYDKIFALAMIFPEFKKKIKYNYTQYLGNLETKFYRYLARQDPTILFFGTFDKKDVTESVQDFRRAQVERAPSWAGVKGAHSLFFDIKCMKLRGFHYEIRRNIMTINSTFISIRFHDESEVTTVSDHPLRFIKHMNKPMRLSPARPGTLSFSRMPQKVPEKYKALEKDLGTMPTHLLPLEMTARTAHNTLNNAKYFGAALTLTEESSEGVILTGLLFDQADIELSLEKELGGGVGRKNGNYLPHELDHAFPVFAKAGDDLYKAVGLAYFYPSLVFKYMENVKVIRVE